MTQEDKQLLIKDLCARLPYGVKVKYKSEESGNIEIGEIEGIDSNEIHEIYGFYLPDRYIYSVDEFIPYLRPMSTMTKKEIEEYRNLSDEVIGSYGPYHHKFIAHCVRLGIKPDNPHECVDEFLNMEAIDWLLAHHFDFRGLIEKDLALEALSGMYKTE